VTLFKYEKRDAPVLPLGPFLRRMVRHGAIVFEFALVSIAIGMAGFHLFADQAWIDAFLNTAMLLAWPSSSRSPFSPHRCCIA